MTGLTTKQTESLLDDMLLMATDLVVAVRDGDQSAVAGIIEPLDTFHSRTLMIVLAALVPIDIPLNELTAWTHDNLVVSFNLADQLPIGDPSFGEKECTGCRRVLPLLAFHVDRSRRDGHTYKCRDCRNGTTATKADEEVAA